MSQQPVTGGEMVVAALEAEGIRTTFGIPAQHNLAIYDALLDHPHMRQVLARHELGAAYMADGYARATGMVGVVNVVGGPGLTNAATGLLEANAASMPILVITTTIHTALINKNKQLTHELPGQELLFEKTAHWRYRVSDIQQIPGAIHEALARLRTERGGLVVLEIPVDILETKGTVHCDFPPDPPSPMPSSSEIDRAAGLLANAKSPVIWAGGGVVAAGATDLLRQLAEKLGAPVFTTEGGKGALPDDHPLALGSSWVKGDAIYEILTQADVMLGVGTTFSFLMTENFTLPLPRQLIQIDIDAAEIGKNYPVEIGLVGDAQRVLEMMLRQLNARSNQTKPGRVIEIRDAKRQARQAGEVEAARYSRAKGGSVLDLLDQLREALPRDGILMLDSQIAYWAARYFPAYEPRTVHMPIAFGSLGFSLPAAIAAKIAYPDRAVVSLVGDGAFMFTCQELGVAVQENLSLPIIVYNDHGHGSIRWNQKRRYQRFIAADLVQPDFVAFAKSFGAHGERVTDILQLGSIIRKALAAAGPTLIEVEMAIEPPHMN